MPQLCTFGAAAARGFGLTEESAQLPDDDFNLTTLLLPGNGTNGAQNNTFIDSSTNNFTITRNGNTTQGTFSPFSFGGGTAPADGYYSGYFDGNGDYLSNTTANVQLTGNFTVEMYLYPTTVSAGNSFLYAIGAEGGSRFAFYLKNGVPYLNINAGAETPLGSTSVVANQWQHLAFVRVSTTITAYINGVSVGSTGAYTGTLGNSTQFYIGSDSGNTSRYTGFISNFRAVNGTAVYTSNFTVPTTPLTAITNTQLLTCQSSQFIDNSTNAFAITPGGNSQPAVVNPFGMTDWSGYFDGTGDYLSVANNAAFLLATNNFTIEFWVYPTNVSSTQSILSKGAGGYSPFLIQNSSGSGLIYISSAGSAWDVASGVSLGTIPISTWTHIAITREGNTFKTFKNGIQVSTFSSSASLYNPANPVTIGYNGGGYPEAFYGNISNLRIVNGTALYTANFTPPTAPLTAVTNTTLLTCQSSTFIDNSTNAFAITVNGNAYTGTLNNPFGSIVNYTTPPLQAWSNYFGGGSSTERRLTATQTAIGTGNFTIAFWVYLVGTTGNDQQFFDTGTGGFVISIDTSTRLQLQNRAAGTTVISPSSATAIPLNTWVHVAVVRFGTGASQVTMYVNGSSVGTGTMSTNLTSTTISIGGRFAVDAGVWYTTFGYISNVLYDNSALSITVPTTPYTSQSGTKLLTCQSNRFVDNSINQFAITRNGDTSVQAFSPFNPDAPYSTTSVGGSAYFDGSGDYLTVPDSASFDLPGDFTVEFFAYATGSNVRRWFQLGDYRAGQNGLLIYSASFSSIVVYVNDSVIITGPTLVPYQWVHVACVRQGAGSNNLKLYVNGSLAGQVTNTTSFTGVAGNGISLGAEYGGSFAATFETYMSNVRLVKGTAVYTSAFTPPTAPLTAIANTQLLVNYTNAGIPDATAKNVLETVGNAQISTAQSKFGGSSMYFDGTGDTLLLPPSINNLFITASNFTLEFWYRFASTPGANQYVYSVRQDANNYLYIFATSSGWVFDTFSSGGQGPKITSSSLSHDNTTFHHFALVYNSGTYTMYVDGSSVGSQANSTVLTTLNGYAVSLPYYIGSRANIDSYFNGYLDDFRITKGYARYTTNFTPPTSAFPLF
jgi:hypothetical protein